MRNNFALFEKYPHYIFNFTGANRYRLMKEYYPADFERLKHTWPSGAGSGRIVNGGRRRQLAQRRIDHSADTLWQ